MGGILLIISNVRILYEFISEVVARGSSTGQISSPIMGDEIGPVWYYSWLYNPCHVIISC